MSDPVREPGIFPFVVLIEFPPSDFFSGAGEDAPLCDAACSSPRTPAGPRMCRRPDRAAGDSDWMAMHPAIRQAFPGDFATSGASPRGGRSSGRRSRGTAGRRSDSPEASSAAQGERAPARRGGRWRASSRIVRKEFSTAEGGSESPARSRGSCRPDWAGTAPARPRGRQNRGGCYTSRPDGGQEARFAQATRTWSRSGGLAPRERTRTKGRSNEVI